MFYRVANRSKIKGLGGKKVTFKTKDGSTQSMSFIVADVTKALSSVSKICQRKNRVVFDEDGSCPCEWRVDIAWSTCTLRT